jgi:hypothetical protein
MKYIFFFLQLIIIQTTFAQFTKTDSLIILANDGMDNMNLGYYDISEKDFNRTISIDSSYFEIYALRSLLYITMHSDRCKIDTNYRKTDSIYLKKSIMDLSKSIRLRLNGNLIFPDTLISNLFKGKPDPPHAYELDDFGRLEYIYEDILYGAALYLNSKGNEKDEACKQWNNVLALGIIDVKKLINEFCK